MVSVVMLLVVLAGLGAALAGISTRQQLGAATQLDHSRAQLAAKAGLEWAAWQVLRNPAAPAAAPACFTTTSLTPAGSGFTVTVSCRRTPASGTLNDGVTNLAFFQVVANACNAPTAGECPNAAAVPDAAYVERQLSATLAR